MRRLLLVVLLFSIVVPVRADDILVLTVSTDQGTYEAGDRGVMDVTFTNQSDHLVEDIDIQVKSNDIVFFTKNAAIESILYGSETVQFKFQCKNLEDGLYSVLISYNYTATSKQCQGGVCQKIEDKKPYEIIISNGEPHISLESNVLTVVDNIAEITFKNSSKVAIDFQFEVTSDLQMQYEQYIGYVLTSGSKDMVVYGEPGEYQGSVTVKYRDRFGRDYEKSFVIKIVIQEEEEIAVLHPKKSVGEIRKIQVHTASAEGTPMSQYYVYVMVGSCLCLIGVAMVAKLKRLK
jgi:hypothetical protein